MDWEQFLVQKEEFIGKTITSVGMGEYTGTITKISSEGEIVNFYYRDGSENPREDHFSANMSLYSIDKDEETGQITIGPRLICGVPTFYID